MNRTERWASKTYRDIRDYSLMGSPVWLQERAQSFFRDTMVQRLNKHHQGRERYTRAIDLGCGIGDWTPLYLSLTEQVVGVDVNPSFLQQARTQNETFAHRDRVQFVQAPIQEWTDFSNVGFVALGACAMYLSDAELQAVLTRVASALAPQGMLYVRASVVTRWRDPFDNAEGYYRTPYWYEERFARHGFSIADRAPSAGIVIDGLLQQLPRSQWLRTALSNTAHAKRTVRKQIDFFNWVLFPSSAP